MSGDSLQAETEASEAVTALFSSPSRGIWRKVDCAWRCSPFREDAGIHRASERARVAMGGVRGCDRDEDGGVNARQAGFQDLDLDPGCTGRQTLGVRLPDGCVC